MGDSKAYILVTTSVPVKLRNSCTAGDVKNHFLVKVNDVRIEPVNIFVNHPGFPQHPGKILIELNKSDIPRPDDKLEVTYINKSSFCNIIHRNLLESLSIPLSDFSYNTEKHEIISSMKEEDFPAVVDIDSPNENGGKSIFVSISEFRNISNSSNFDNFNIIINPTVNSVYNSVVFSNTPTLVNKRLKFVATTGAMEKGTTYDVSYTGNNIKDQHGFLLNTFSTAPVECKNSVQNLIFHSASVETTSPNKIFLRFKDSVTNNLVSVSNNLLLPYNNPLNTYKMYVINDSLNYDITLTADVVKTIIPEDENNRGVEYTSPVIFKHNDDISVEWDSRSENKQKCIKDVYNNIVFNSRYDPKAGIDTENSSAIKIENNIDGITINTNTSLISQNISGFDILLNFTRIKNNDEIVPITLIDLNVNNFKIKNNSVNKEFFPDNVVNENGDIILSIDYNTQNFDKVINIYDSVTVDYLDENWPSTIKDNYDNYMLKQTDIQINNNIVYGGSVVLIEELIEEPLKIKLTYSSDICGNSVSPSNFVIRVLGDDKPSIIGVEQDPENSKIIFLLLDKQSSDKLYLSTVPDTIKNKNGVYVTSLNDTLVTKFLQVLNIDVPEEDGGKQLNIEVAEDKILSGLNLDGFSVSVFKSFKSNYESVTFNTTATIDNDKKNQLRLQVLDGLIEEGDTFNISYTNPVNTYIKDQFDLVLHDFVYLWGNSILSNSIKSLMINDVYIETETSDKITILFQKNVNGPVVNIGNDISWSYNNSSNEYKAYKISSEEILTEINVLFVKSIMIDGLKTIEFTLDQTIKYNENIAISWDSKLLTSENRIIDEYGNEIFSSMHDLKNKPYGELDAIDVNNNIDGITIKENPDLIIKENVESLQLELDVYFKRIISGDTVKGFINTSGGATENDFVIKNHTTNKSFNPDNISSNEDGYIHLTVDLTNLNFDKTISRRDVISLQVINDDIIYDEFNNFMLELNEFSVKNNVGVNGSLSNIKIENEEFDKVVLSFEVDIRENTLNKDDFVFSPTKTIKSAILSEPNKIIITLENDIIENSNYTLSLKEDSEIRNIYGTEIETFENEAIVIDSLNIKNINVETSNGGKAISIFFPLTRNILHSLNFDGFTASIISNNNGNYLKEDITFGLTIVRSSNKIEIPVLSGVLQKETVYDISYSGSDVKDQYNKSLNHFSTAPVNCDNSLYTVIYNSGSVSTETPKKIRMDFSKKTTHVTMGINIDELNYNNELGYYKLYIDSVETTVISVKTINISGKVYLEYTISDPINYKNILHVAWDFNNLDLTLDKRIRSLDGIEAHSSQEINNVVNNIDGFKIVPTSNVSQKINYFEIKLNFSRIYSDNIVIPFNVSGGDVFDNSYLNDFSIKRNEVLIMPDSIMKNDNSLVLTINYNETDFSNVIDMTDDITVEYVGNKTITDEFTNVLLNETPINIINNVTNIGNLFNATRSSVDKNEIILLFDTDICGNTISKEDFEITIPSNPHVFILNVIKDFEKTLKILLSEEIHDTTNSTISLKENYSLRTNYGIKLNRFIDKTIEQNPDFNYGLRIENGISVYQGQDIQVKGTEYLVLNPNVDTSYNFEIYYGWVHKYTNKVFFSQRYDYREITQAYPSIHSVGQQFSVETWGKLRAYLIFKNIEEQFNTIEIDEVDVLENNVPILNTPVTSNYYVNVDQTIGISMRDTIIDPDGGDIQYEVLSIDTLPSWISFNNGTFTIQNPTIEEVGDYTISTKGYDDKMAPLFFDFTVTVQDTIEPLNITVQNNSGSILGSSHTMNEDTGFTFSNIVTTGGERSSILIKVIDGKTLPSWLILSSTNEDGAATLTGTPPDGDLTYTIDLTATDGTNNSNVSFDIHVISVNSPTTGSVAIVYPTFLIPGKTINAVPSFTDDEGIKSITYSWKRVYHDGRLDNASVGTVLNNGINGASYTLSLDDIGYKIQVWCIVTDNEDMTHPEDSSNSFKSNISELVLPEVIINDVGMPITSAPDLGSSSLTVNLKPGDENNLVNVTYQWQVADVDNIFLDIPGQNNVSYTLLNSDVGKQLRVKSTFANPTSGFTDIHGGVSYSSSTGLITDTRPVITNINVVNESPDSSLRTTYLNSEQVKLEVTFSKKVRIETADNIDSIPDINLQIGGFGNEPNINHNRGVLDEFIERHRKTAVFDITSSGLSWNNVGGIFKTENTNKLVFIINLSDPLDNGIVELWGAAYYQENTKSDRLLSLSGEGSQIKSETDKLANLHIPGLFSELSVNIKYVKPPIVREKIPNLISMVGKNYSISNILKPRNDNIDSTTYSFSITPDYSSSGLFSFTSNTTFCGLETRASKFIGDDIGVNNITIYITDNSIAFGPHRTNQFTFTIIPEISGDYKSSNYGTINNENTLTVPSLSNDILKSPIKDQIKEISYKWQSSVDGSTWTDISSSETNYTPDTFSNNSINVTEFLQNKKLRYILKVFSNVPWPNTAGKYENIEYIVESEGDAIGNKRLRPVTQWWPSEGRELLVDRPEQRMMLFEKIREGPGMYSGDYINIYVTQDDFNNDNYDSPIFETEAVGEKVFTRYYYNRTTESYDNVTNIVRDATPGSEGIYTYTEEGVDDGSNIIFVPVRKFKWYSYPHVSYDSDIIAPVVIESDEICLIKVELNVPDSHSGSVLSFNDTNAPSYSYSYQWQTSTTLSGFYQNLYSSDAIQYRVQSGDIEKYIRLKVSYTINGQTINRYSGGVKILRDH